MESVDIAPFLAAIIAEAGGLVKVPYGAVFNENDEDVALAFDIEDDGATIAIRLVSMEEAVANSE